MKVSTAARLIATDRSRWTNVASLVRGTVLAQLVFIVATPLLTRVYTAAELGVFAVLVAVVLVLAKLAGLRYELAIPLTRTDRLALHAVALTVGSGALLLALAWGAYELALASGVLRDDLHVLQSNTAVVVLGCALFVVNEAQVFWFIRKQRFSIIANARVINAASLATIQLLAIFTDHRLPVLLWAYPLALSLSVAYLLRHTARSRRGPMRLSVRSLRRLAYRHREFPIYSTWSTAIFELSQALPLFVLSGLFGSAQAAYFFLARRIGLVPTSIVGRAITQVNHAEMAARWRDGTLAGPIVRQIHQLQWVAVCPAWSCALIAPTLCEWALGEGWRVTGYYLLFIAPYVLVRFVFAPIGAINFVAGWQRQAFWFELGSMAVSIAALMVFAGRGQAEYSVAAYFLVQFICNLLYRSYLLQRLGIRLRDALWPMLVQILVLGALTPFLMPLLAIDLVGDLGSRGGLANP